MKIWHGYGSEHSMNLVMVGSFKTVEDAKAAKDLIDNLTNRLAQKLGVDGKTARYNDETMAVLKEENFYVAAPMELEQLSYDYSLEIEGDKLIFKTEESDFSVFLKAMIEKGGKIEVYSAHEYQDEPHGRGK
jgi:hypothetical protein